jgi:hypothetical protein
VVTAVTETLFRPFFQDRPPQHDLQQPDGPGSDGRHAEQAGRAGPQIRKGSSSKTPENKSVSFKKQMLLIYFLRNG